MSMVETAVVRQERGQSFGKVGSLDQKWKLKLEPNKPDVKARQNPHLPQRRRFLLGTTWCSLNCNLNKKRQGSAVSHAAQVLSTVMKQPLGFHLGEIFAVLVKAAKWKKRGLGWRVAKTDLRE